MLILILASLRLSTLPRVSFLRISSHLLSKLYLIWIHDIIIHPQNFRINSRNCVQKTVKRGSYLELFEEASDDTSCCGSRKSDLVIDDHGCYDLSPSQSLTEKRRFVVRKSDKLYKRKCKHF